MYIGGHSVEIRDGELHCCGEPMEFICAYSDDEYYAYNLYICNTCGTLAKDNLLEGDGIVILSKTGVVRKTAPCHAPKAFALIRKLDI